MKYCRMWPCFCIWVASFFVSLGCGINRVCLVLCVVNVVGNMFCIGCIVLDSVSLLRYLYLLSDWVGIWLLVVRIIIVTGKQIGRAHV